MVQDWEWPAKENANKKRTTKVILVIIYVSNVLNVSNVSLMWVPIAGTHAFRFY
jgi:hypothetical protein